MDDGEVTRLNDAETASAGLWLRMAGGRLAVQYLERAADWAADVDQDIVWEVEQIRLKLLYRLRRLEEMSGPDSRATGDGPADR
jgi:hypothetical protein